MKKILVMLLMMPAIAFAQWSGNWQSKGSDALIGLSTEPTNPDYAKNSYLVIGYSKQFACSPIVSVLIINGQSLGSPISQKKSKSSKNQLSVVVNGKSYTDSTTLNQYENGIELAMRGSHSLIEELSKPNSSIDVSVGNTRILNFAKSNGFLGANAIARNNCK